MVPEITSAEIKRADLDHGGHDIWGGDFTLDDIIHSYMKGNKRIKLVGLERRSHRGLKADFKRYGIQDDTDNLELRLTVSSTNSVTSEVNSPFVYCEVNPLQTKSVRVAGAKVTLHEYEGIHYAVLEPFGNVISYKEVEHYPTQAKVLKGASKKPLIGTQISARSFNGLLNEISGAKIALDSATPREFMEAKHRSAGANLDFSRLIRGQFKTEELEYYVSAQRNRRKTEHRSLSYFSAPAHLGDPDRNLELLVMLRTYLTGNSEAINGSATPLLAKAFAFAESVPVAAAGAAVGLSGAADLTDITNPSAVIDFLAVYCLYRWVNIFGFKRYSGLPRDMYDFITSMAHRK